MGLCGKEAEKARIITRREKPMGILYDRLLILLNESSSDSTFYHIALTMLQNMD